MSLSDFQNFSQFVATSATALQEQSTFNVPAPNASFSSSSFDPNNYAISPLTSEEQHNFLKKYKILIICRHFKHENKEISWDEINHTLSRVIRETKDNGEISLIETHSDGTPTLDKALHHFFEKHFKEKETNHQQKTIILVVTDEIASNREDIENTIVHYVNKVDTKNIFSYRGNKKTLELGIRFFQVGHKAGLSTYLHSLHRRLKEKGAKIDISDNGNILDLNTVDDVRKALCKAIY